jgi:hypothetical protein
MTRTDGKIHEGLKDIAVRAIEHAAKETKVSVNADAVGFVCQPQFLSLGAPIVGIEKLNIEKLWDEHILDNAPFMCWHFSGELFEHSKSPIPAGSYLVIAHKATGTVSLQNAAGKTISTGKLCICINNPPPVMKKVTKSGGIDSVTGTIWPPHIKVCGHVTVSDGKTKVTITACVEAGF